MTKPALPFSLSLSLSLSLYLFFSLGSLDSPRRRDRASRNSDNHWSASIVKAFFIRESTILRSRYRNFDCPSFQLRMINSEFRNTHTHTHTHTCSSVHPFLPRDLGRESFRISHTKCFVGEMAVSSIRCQKSDYESASRVGSLASDGKLRGRGIARGQLHQEAKRRGTPIRAGDLCLLALRTRGRAI